MALFVLISLTNLAMARQTHQAGSSLRLFLPPASEYIVIFDNVPYYGVYDRFKIDNLRPGNHRLKITKPILNRRGYVIDRIVIYNGMLFFPRNTKIWASINHRGMLRIERSLSFDDIQGNGNGRNQGNGSRENRRRDDDYDYDRNQYGNNQNNREEEDEDWYYRDRSSQRSDRSDANRGNDTYDREGQRETAFANTLNAIKKQSFDSERLKMAKNIVSSESMLSEEILLITKLFSFESTRLEFAKFAYSHTSDKRNYVMVQEAFQFSSSKSELQDYITQMGKR